MRQLIKGEEARELSTRREPQDSKKEFVGLNAVNNVYKAWGSFLREPLYQWAKETNAKALQLNQHVSYIHSKFLLMDPLGKDPIVPSRVQRSQP
jgi:hypothetical protein